MLHSFFFTGIRIFSIKMTILTRNYFYLLESYLKIELWCSKSHFFLIPHHTKITLNVICELEIQVRNYIHRRKGINHLSSLMVLAGSFLLTYTFLNYFWIYFIYKSFANIFIVELLFGLDLDT